MMVRNCDDTCKDNGRPSPALAAALRYKEAEDRLRGLVRRLWRACRELRSVMHPDGSEALDRRVARRWLKAQLLDIVANLASAGSEIPS
jgi:hypothetical protein